jgi:MSHA pilin protein MshC
MKKTSAGKNGFTIMEIVAVLIVLSILAAVAVNRVSYSGSKLIAQADTVKSHLRFAQLKALQDDVNSWKVEVSPSSYSILCEGGDCPASIILPSESSHTHHFPAGVTASADTTVAFDSWGSPGDEALEITLTEGGKTLTINIAAHTGYITP